MNPQTKALLERALAVLSRYAHADIDADILSDEIVRTISPGICEYPECQEGATSYTTYSRTRQTVERLCQAHAERVSDENNPEYIVGCPDCCCIFSVN